MNQPNKSKGKLVVISGPSGVGKSTICAEIIRRTDAVLSISATTRPKAAIEVEGKDYRFISRSEFEKKIAENAFLEYAEVFGNFYGTPKETVEESLRDGRTVILEIDVQGGTQVKKQYPQAIMIFIMPPSHDELVKRLTRRARDDSDEAARRLKKAEKEIAAGQSYEYKVVNEDLKKAVDEIIGIINCYGESRND